MPIGEDGGIVALNRSIHHGANVFKDLALSCFFIKNAIKSEGARLLGSGWRPVGRHRPSGASHGRHHGGRQVAGHLHGKGRGREGGKDEKEARERREKEKRAVLTGVRRWTGVEGPEGFGRRMLVGVRCEGPQVDAEEEGRQCRVGM